MGGMASVVVHTAPPVEVIWWMTSPHLYLIQIRQRIPYIQRPVRRITEVGHGDKVEGDVQGGWEGVMRA